MRSDVMQILAACDLFVMSSRREGFPIALVEALHSRIPIVSTEVAGAREVLPKEVLVPIGDPAALAETVTRVLEWPEAQRMGQYDECFQMAETELAVDGMAGRTLACYQALLEKG
jgi:glycosyltransferase involved in cell wall biosynthesis